MSEKGKDKLSSNGTFVFMKSHTQMTQHEPSDLIPLTDGMVISFINYEIRVNLEKKDATTFEKEAEIITAAQKTLGGTQDHGFEATVKAQAPEVVVTEEVSVPVEHHEEAEAVEEVEAQKVEAKDEHGAVADQHEQEQAVEAVAVVEAADNVATEHHAEEAESHHDQQVAEADLVEAAEEV